MPLRLKTPEEKEFPLLEADATGETKIAIRQATQRENELRADLWATASRVIKDGVGGEMELKQRISFPEVARREVFLTLVSCNIENGEGQPLFRFRDDSATHRRYLAMSEADFAEAWGKLPAPLATEIHSKVIEVNPSWGTMGE